MRASWVVLAGCYAPSPPDGIACGTDDECPSSQFCAFHQCVSAAPACLPIEAAAGKLDILAFDVPPTIDGSLDDWPTCFVTVDLDTAGQIRDLGPGGKYAPGRFSIASAGGRLFVGAELLAVAPLGDHVPPDVYLNSAISVYFDADGVSPTSRYDDDAAQIVIDHANRRGAFRSGNGGVIDVPDVTSAARVGDTTFAIEMSISPATLGASEFAGTIGFDIGLVGGDGELMTSELVWFQACAPPACECTNGDSAPYCDARQFGTATFAR